MSEIAKKLKRVLMRCARIIFVAPLVGAVCGVREAWSLPAESWRDLFVNSMRCYFAPITGAFAGVKKELLAQDGKD